MDDNKLKFLINLQKEIEKKNNSELKREFYSMAKSEIEAENLNRTPDEILDNINEYCIENIISKQAQSFYSDFPLINLKDRLVKDFIMMEHHRKRDEFWDFGLRVHQQIECIVSELFTNSLLQKLKAEQNQKTFLNKNFNKAEKKYEYKRHGNVLKGELLFLKKDKDIPEYNSIPYKNKLRVILYYYYFNEQVPNKQSLENIYETGYQIYITRNQTHRGNQMTDKQKETFDKIRANKYSFYLIYNGFLANFIRNIAMNIKS